MKQISSSSNPLYKSWLRLSRQSGTKGDDLLLEGVHVCQAWLARFGAPQWALFKEGSQCEAEITELTTRVSPDHQAWLDARLMRALSSMSSEPSVIFVVPMPKVAPRQTLFESAVVLDAVQDPGNVGTILRTVAGAGIKQVFAGLGTASCWSAKALRAGQGAQFSLTIHESVDLGVWLDTVVSKSGDASVRPMVLATTLVDGATPLFDLDLPDQVIWLFGHEGRGVSQAISVKADRKVYIPHEASAVESLNVASAVAICLFEHRRQHHKPSNRGC
jgi:TrmH family RNA methyltransferase